MSDTAPDNRVSIIEAVKTPLGFFTFVALILDGLLIGAGAFTEQRLLWAALGVLVLLIVLVTGIVMMKPDALYGPAKRMTVNLLFPDPIEVELDAAKCLLEVSDNQNRIKLKGQPDLVWEQGGWTLRLGDVDVSDGVRLELVEHNARRWRVNRFAPYQKSVQARPVEQP